MKYKLSVIIPFYKGDEFLPILLNSLESSYNSSKKNLNIELILIVDSPEKNTFFFKKNIENYSCLNIILKKNDINIGVAKSRDLGVKLSTGDFITFIDQDDNVNLSYFPVLEKEIDKDVDLFIQNGYVLNLIDNKRVNVFYYKPSINLHSFVLNNKVLTPSLIVVNKKVIDEYKIHFTLPFDEYKGIDDWYFILQILIKLKKIRYKWIRNKNINYCIHRNNYSNNLIEPINGSIKVLKYVRSLAPSLSTLVKSRIEVLEFSKLLYNTDQRKLLYLHPILFLRFLLQYLHDINRLIRFVHRKLIGLAVRY